MPRPRQGLRTARSPIRAPRSASERDDEPGQLVAVPGQPPRASESASGASRLKRRHSSNVRASKRWCSAKASSSARYIACSSDPRPEPASGDPGGPGRPREARRPIGQGDGHLEVLPDRREPAPVQRGAPVRIRVLAPNDEATRGAVAPSAAAARPLELR